MGTADELLVDDDVDQVPALPRPTAWHEAVPRLRVAVRALSFGPSAAPPPLGRPLVPFIVSRIAIDDEVADLTVTQADLATWGVDEDRVWEIALNNVLEADLEIRASAVAPNALDVVGPERCISAWLMIPDAIALLSDRLEGDTVVTAPSLDRLLIIGTADRDALALALDWAFVEYQQSPRQLSPLPYVVRDDTVSEWRPDEADPCAVKVGRARRIFTAVEYASQQQALDEFLLDADEEIFAASLFVRERTDGSIWTFASWVLDVDSVLPIADYVDVVVGPGDQFMVSWADALSMAAAVLEPVANLDPPRWRAAVFPPTAVLDALRGGATDPTILTPGLSTT